MRHASQQKRPAHVSVGSKANIAELEGHVRFVPEADILRCGEKCRYSIT
jgi:hypothetical protein